MPSLICAARWMNVSVVNKSSIDRSIAPSFLTPSRPHDFRIVNATRKGFTPCPSSSHRCRKETDPPALPIPRAPVAEDGAGGRAAEREAR